MPMEWVGPLISGAAVVLVAIIEAIAARERKRIKADNQKSDALMNGVQALLRREIIAEYNHYSEQRYIPIYGMENVLDLSLIHICPGPCPRRSPSDARACRRASPRPP